MKLKKIIPSIFVLGAFLLFTQCEKEELAIRDNSQTEAFSNNNIDDGSMKKPEGAGNCLSFPVIWAEDATKALREPPSTVPPYLLNGEWWYTRGSNGSDPDITAASCPPDPDEGDIGLNPDGDPFCDDGIPNSLTLPAGELEADNPLPLARAYLQKDLNNIWQAEVLDEWPNDNIVDKIDWGDNLESVDWYTRSQVRTEVVLFEENLGEPWLEYVMRHTSGWGIDEVHGLGTDLGGIPLDESDDPLYVLGSQATVFSSCARLTIQKLFVDEPDDPVLADLVWDVETKEWLGEGIINTAIFNMAVHEAQDGPGYYNAEVNVKGKIIYGYTWNVRRLNEGAGLYRITFSFDENCGTAPLNTFFDDELTEIIIPLEEEIIAQVAIAESDDSGDTGGGTGVLRGDLNLTYMDIKILERSGGGGGSGKGGGSGGGGSGGNGGGRK